jgi:antagonist of KipI
MITILRPGMQATVQDAGRVGVRQYGIPASGAADELSYRVANMLVGNMQGQAALEILPGGFAAQFERDALIALAGARVVATITDAKVQNRPVPLGRPVLVRSGSIISLTRFVAGLRAYLAIAGGVDVERVLGSRSTYLYGRFGGLGGAMLKKDDVLRIGSAPELAARIAMNVGVAAARMSRSWMASGWFATPLMAWATLGRPEQPRVLRVLRGPQWDIFTPQSQERFCSQLYRVTWQADRMGIRLEPSLYNGLLTLNAQVSASAVSPHEMISTAVLAGVVQVPSQGAPILLLADAQTTGGYPIIASVCSVDMARAGQLAPGDMVRFAEITLDEAHEHLRRRERVLKLMQYGIEAAARGMFR